MHTDDVLVFEAAWRCGSLTAAARELGLAQATLSRRLARLEEALGHRLIHRGPPLALTPAGEALMPRARGLAATARALKADAEALDGRPRGRVRVAVPPGLAVHVLARLAPELRRRHPELVLEVLASIDYADLAAGEADLAIRGRPSSHPELVQRVLAHTRGGVYVASSLAQRLDPSPALDALEWVGFPDSHRHLPNERWLHELVESPRYAFRSDSYVALVAAAQCGLGALLATDLDVALVEGLVRLPLAIGAPELPVYLVLHRATRGVPRIRAVADFLIEQAAAMQARARAEQAG